MEPEALRDIRRRHPDLHLDPHRPYRWLNDLAEDEGLEVLDLLPPFRAARSEAPLHYRFQDEHWNRRGHALAAATVAAELRQRIPGCRSGPGGSDF